MAAPALLTKLATAAATGAANAFNMLFVDVKGDGSQVAVVHAVIDTTGALVSPATDATAQAILAALQGQRAESLWTDDTGTFVVRVDKNGTISWSDLSGNAASAPGAGARPAAGSTVLLSRSAYQATAAGAGVAVNDYLDHFVTTDPASGAVLGNFWVNISTGAKLAAAPAAASITPVSALPTGAASSALQQSAMTAVGTPLQAGVALPAGEAHLGEVGGNIAKVTASFGPASSTPYTAGQVMSAPIAMVLARKPGGSFVLTGATLAFAVANTVEVDLVVYTSQPAATYTAGAVPPNNAADRAKIAAVLKVTDWTLLSTTDSVGEVVSGSKLVTADDATATQTVWVVPVARGTITLASATDASLTLRASRN